MSLPELDPVLEAEMHLYMDYVRVALEDATRRAEAWLRNAETDVSKRDVLELVALQFRAQLDVIERALKDLEMH